LRNKINKQDKNVSKASIWAVVPAASIGIEAGEKIPKQYYPLAGKSVLDVTLEKLLRLASLEGIVVAISAADIYWQKTSLVNHPRVFICLGAATRAETVANALKFVAEYAQHQADSWVLVHDALRPCVSLAKIEALVDLSLSENCAAILATPVDDCLKRVSHGNLVSRGEDASKLWRANTPQFFRLAKLRAALEYCRERGISVLDEASAVEHVGGRVQVLSDRRDNIRIRSREDLPWAEFLLEAQESNA